MADDWSEIEVELIIADYFSMLFDELAGKPINKTEHRRKLLPLLNNRNESSIEFKHQNISAALRKFGYPFILGYKPLPKYQKALLDRKIAEYLNDKSSFIIPKFENFADQTVDFLSPPKFENWIDSAPEQSRIEEPPEPYFKPIQINYLEKEQHNRSLGLLGEDLVMQYERWRLIKAGKEALISKIEWISKEKGDGAGYDILSRNVNGTDRFIEVKSTKLTKDTPIFFSKTEYNFSIRNSENYWLYRVFNIQNDPKMFHLNGKFDDFCYMEPTQYKGTF